MRYVFILLLLISSTAQAGEIKIWHCNGGVCPVGVRETNTLVITPIYALSNNKETKFADWLAYRVTPASIGATVNHARNWKNDPLLSVSDTLEVVDYKAQHDPKKFVIGHQTPLSAFSGTIF